MQFEEMQSENENSIDFDLNFNGHPDNERTESQVWAALCGQAEEEGGVMNFSVVDSEASLANATIKFAHKQSIISNHFDKDQNILYGYDGKPLIDANGKPLVGGLAENNDNESVRLDDGSVYIGAFDVDVDEVKDRIDLLKDTVEEIAKEGQAKELVKIVSKT